MSGGDMMFGKCDCCGKDKPLLRTYFYYPIKCQCHNNQHVESIDHCADCVPKKPEETKVWLSMQQITQLSALREENELQRQSIQDLSKQVVKLQAERDICGKWPVRIGEYFCGAEIVGADYKRKTVTIEWRAMEVTP